VPFGKKKAIFLARNADTSGHGGNRRSAQLVDLVRAKATVCHAESPFGGGLLKNLKLGARGAIRSLATRSLRMNSRYLRNVGACDELLDALQVDPDTTVVIESYVVGLATLIKGVQRKGGRVALFPQNLDSLVPSGVHPYSGRKAPYWLCDEINVICNADHVCCISREEQWLLTAYGIDALHLPYYPTQPILDSLLAIRKRRETTKKTKLLVLGSAINEPTRLGMVALLEHSKELRRAVGRRDVVVAGYGTERLVNKPSSSGIRVAGAVTPQALDDLLSEAWACVCYQAGTSGALTRIPELLVAGVPVVANAVAARSYWGVPGLTIAERLPDLFETLRGGVPELVPVPARPSALETIVSNTIWPLPVVDNLRGGI